MSFLPSRVNVLCGLLKPEWQRARFFEVGVVFPFFYEIKNIILVGCSVNKLLKDSLYDTPNSVVTKGSFASECHRARPSQPVAVLDRAETTHAWRFQARVHNMLNSD